MPTVVVVDHDPAWAGAFERLRARAWPAVEDLALSMEHVGSTAIPELAAKPIIDASPVLRSEADLTAVVARLAPLGYVHLGDLGIQGPEAFDCSALSPPHPLYACPRGGLGLRNHLAVRDHSRAHPESVRAYGELKRRLAAEHPEDIDASCEGNSEFLLGVLRAAGSDPASLDADESSNRA